MGLDSRKDMVRGSRRRNMRNQDTSPSSLMIKKKSRRKIKTRKPKYLSLRLRFSADQEAQDNMPSSSSTTTTVTDDDDDDAADRYENMANYLFSAADGGATTTLTGLLGAATTTTATLSPSAYAYWRQKNCELVRTAMRRNNKEREASEERWVRYSEVVDQRRRDIIDQEVSSCCGAVDSGSSRNQRLLLKLDYEEILKTWSDKGSLYLHNAATDADSLQIVPHIHPHFLASQLTNRMSDVWGNNGGCVWRVPEMMRNKANEEGLRLIKVKAEEQQGQLVEVVVAREEESKAGQREACVQRYKEKRQNRLFSKRIRYQVRKLNAEKRPRLKGRFVKRS
ncbi:hypothetical protein ACH5RR_014487 [Cinchona calisaya]|uniref:CCT domain-containing protein n=1 Tax=Cinchona calisaya TaxID=153742 RepID=A0ABD3A2Z3_9GENT